MTRTDFWQIIGFVLNLIREGGFVHWVVLVTFIRALWQSTIGKRPDRGLCIDRPVTLSGQLTDLLAARIGATI